MGVDLLVMGDPGHLISSTLHLISSTVFESIMKMCSECICGMYVKLNSSIKRLFNSKANFNYHIF